VDLSVEADDRPVRVETMLVLELVATLALGDRAPTSVIPCVLAHPAIA
jgi:hypothetical protein